MLYETLKVKDKEYKLRLNARSCVDLEKKLGANPINILIQSQDGSIPSMEVLLTILHASMQPYQSNISLNDVYDIFDEYVDEGNTLTDLIPLIVNIFKVSGFFKESEVKNAPKRVEVK